MRSKHCFFFLILLGLTAVLLSACQSNRRGSVSQATGWRYNDPTYGGFEVVEGYRPITPPGLVFVEGGTFIMGRTEQDVVYDWNNSPRRVTVSSFYIDETETTNVVYREYLFWIRRVLVGHPSVYYGALPDTLVWRSPMAYNEAYVLNYFRHPAYNDYPVVGVSWRQVMDFAHWRSNRVNELMLHQMGIIDLSMAQLNERNFDTDAYLLGLYDPEGHTGLPSMKPGEEETGRRVSIEDGIMHQKYRLPTEAEWEYAAYGLQGNTVDETVAERKIYPWNDHNVRSSGNHTLGIMMGNFQRGRGDYMGTAGELNDRGDITVPVDSFFPNDFGLYCMAGNVNEWVLDVYRPLTFEDVDDFRPFRGNVFDTYVTDANDPRQVAGVDSIGQVRRRQVTDEEVANRRNYDKAYYLNYRDGDIQSSLLYNSGTTNTEAQNTTEMYFQGVDEGKVKNVGMTTLINDQARVYKGGGWRDRAFWMSPGARRFLDENASTCDIGFRLAMDAVGMPAAIDRR